MELDPEPAPLSRAAVVVIATELSPGEHQTLAEEPFRGRSLLAEIVNGLGPLPMVVVVVRDESAASLVDGVANVVVVVDPEWREGSAAPLRAGLDFVAQSGDIDVAFVMDVAAPDVAVAVLEALVVAREDAATLVAVPKYRYVRGGPVLLSREIWPRLLGAEGHLDIDSLLLAHPQWVTEVRVDHPPPRRIVSLDDLRELAR